MKVKVLEEAGYNNALLGMSLSYYDHALDLDAWWNDEKFTRAERVAKSLAFKGLGHSKYLESIQVLIYVQASRSFWSEMDTYRVGITKQSSSTMHTLDKRYVNASDFEEGTSDLVINAFNVCLSHYRDPMHKHYKNITVLKNNLPEGWLQERLISTNYKCLQNIISQRKNHRLEYWKIFVASILDQVEHPEYLVEEDSNDRH